MTDAGTPDSKVVGDENITFRELKDNAEQYRQWGESEMKNIKDNPAVKDLPATEASSLRADVTEDVKFFEGGTAGSPLADAAAGPTPGSAEYSSLYNNGDNYWDSIKFQSDPAYGLYGTDPANNMTGPVQQITPPTSTPSGTDLPQNPADSARPGQDLAPGADGGFNLDQYLQELEDAYKEMFKEVPPVEEGKEGMIENKAAPEVEQTPLNNP